jgi:hypothetical protein
MGFDTQADDWMVHTVGQVGGADGVGGGAWLFCFQSANADFYNANFAFIGGGVGVGGSINGASFAKIPTGSGLGSRSNAWSNIKCYTKFSAADLNWAPGRVTSAGVSLAIGYTLLYVSAMNLPLTRLFHSQPCNGLSIGVGITVMTTIGLWKWVDDGFYDYGE